MKMCVLGIQQTSIEIDNPRTTPAGMTAARSQAALDRFLCSFEPFGSQRSNLRSRIQSQQMGDMAMTDLGFLIILNPFLNTACRW
jgi:hypothetical protein